jgi:TrmH family RNA methyltransferase
LRYEEGSFIVEGPTLVEEAVLAGLDIREQYIREDYEEYEAPIDSHELDSKTFNSVADTDSPRGILAVCAIPDAGSLSFNDSDWLLVLHEISDPGNLGTLVRSAEAAGATGVVLVGNTVDPWSPKTVRASAGAIFHVPVWQVDSLDTLSAVGVRLLGTTSHDSLGVSHPESIYDADVSGLIGIVLGNEAHGLPSDIAVDSWITIEHAGRSESLNVAMAGTVLAMHVARSREEMTQG